MIRGVVRSAVLILISGTSALACSDSNELGAPGELGSSLSHFAGCSAEAAAQVSEIKISGDDYEPRCVRIASGGGVLIEANAKHPLQGMVKNGDMPNPIAQGEPSTGYLEDTTFTFPQPGAFGFYCNVHGSDTARDGTMTGVVYVD